ncbi:MAG: hypothetical protein AAFX93_14190 [Verrucomicrobiota bacterium]
MSTEIEAPEARDPYTESLAALNSQVNLAPRLFEAESEFRPQYAQLDLGILEDVLLGQPQGQAQLNSQLEALGPRPTLANQGLATADPTSLMMNAVKIKQLQQDFDAQASALKEQISTTSSNQRDGGYLRLLEQVQQLNKPIQQASATNEIELVEDLGPRATEAFRSANPNIGNLLAQSDSLAQNQLGPTFGMENFNELLPVLTQDALDGLETGGRLTDDERRAATQDARTAFESRGRSGDVGAVLAEIENNEFARQRREDRSRRFATGVGGLALAGSGSELSQRGSDLANTTQAINNQGAFSTDPFQVILGRASGAPGQAAGVASQGQGFSQTNQLFDPMAFQDLFAQNFAQANTNARQDAQASNDLLGGIIGAAGGIAGGALAMCWVARAVYRDQRWMVFREWLLEQAPEWLKLAYLRFGPELARALRSQPEKRDTMRLVLDRAQGGDLAAMNTLHESLTEFAQ